MRKYLCLFFLLLSAAGCSGEQKKVDPPRICSLSSAAVCLLGRLAVTPAAVDEYSRPFAPAGTPVVGKGSAVSAERLLELKINTIIVWEYQRAAVGHLRCYGIKTVSVAPLRLATLPEFIRELGDLTGKTREAQQLAAEFSRKLASLSVPALQRRVYLELYSRNRGAGRNSYAGDLIAAAGGKNILESTSLTGTDEIIRQDPEIIFYVEHCGSAEEIMKRPGMSNVSAVKNKKIFPVPRKFLVEGAFPLEAVEYLKKRIS